jgi:hypothetical protein
MYWNDFLDMALEVGFTAPRLLTDSPVDVTDPELQQRVGELRFYSATYRLFSFAGAEAGSENYGQTAVYRGTIPQHADELRLDKRFVFKTGESTPICGNTSRLLKASRFAPFFEIIGDDSLHLGVFGSKEGHFPFAEDASEEATSSCC